MTAANLHSLSPPKSLYFTLLQSGTRHGKSLDTVAWWRQGGGWFYHMKEGPQE